MGKTASGSIKLSKNMQDKIRNIESPTPSLAAPWLVGTLLFLLFVFGVWWMADALGWVSGSFGLPPNANGSAPLFSSERPGSDSAVSTYASPTASGEKSMSTTIEKTTTNTTTGTNYTEAAPSSGTGAGVTITPPSTTLPDLFNAIIPGQTRSQLLSLSSTIPTCAGISASREVCTFTDNGDAVVATLVNGTVASKAKSGF